MFFGSLNARHPLRLAFVQAEFEGIRLHSESSTGGDQLNLKFLFNFI